MRLRNLFSKRPPEPAWPFQCQHMRVVDGMGMMGDGLLCLDCGRDKYPEVFGRVGRVIVDTHKVSRDELETVWWPLIAQAEALPGGSALPD